MGSRQNIKALILTADSDISGSVEALLKKRSYDVVIFSGKKEALSFLRHKTTHLAILGDADKSVSPFESMKEIVMTSPMTSLILITDLPKEEVDEKAEGYGILGHVDRNIPSDELESLLENFETITSNI